MREEFIRELVTEVLGPKEINEEINEDPLFGYITGILGPKQKKITEETETELELPFDEISSEEEKEVYQGDAALSESTILSPKKIPSVMGISFMVNKKPDIEVCLTYGIYEKTDNKVWKRKPVNKIFNIKFDVNENSFFLGKNGEYTTKEKSDLEVLATLNETSSGFIVKLNLINNTFQRGINTKTEECIFQPQLRVILKRDEELKQLPLEKFDDADDRGRFEFLYRVHKIPAKGHLCSAVWKDVDPEQIFLKNDKQGISWWVDGDGLRADLKEKFLKANVRTEFIPSYIILAPDFNWIGENAPELNAEKLSQKFNAEEINKALSPLIIGYSKWINELKGYKEDYKEQMDITQKIISECEEVRDRMQEGLNFLIKDEDLRLSFCFANKVLNLQYSWPKKEKSELIWKPFQVGFILMTLESIINPQSKYRKFCDLLWIPTGGGKTEAYMALIALVLAYRRRTALKSDSEKTGAGTAVITRYTLRLLTIQQFRRTVKVLTACEFYRVYDKNGKTGWRPESYNNPDNFLWGSTPFSVGLWVGGEVTPNRLVGDYNNKGAIDLLRDPTINEQSGEVAQILNCPACNSLLAIPKDRLDRNSSIFFISKIKTKKPIEDFKQNNVSDELKLECIIKMAAKDYYTLKFLVLKDINEDVYKTINTAYYNYKNSLSEQGYEITSTNGFHDGSVHILRPGYFLRYYTYGGKKQKQYDFDIICPNPNCELGNQKWFGGYPNGSIFDDRKPAKNKFPDGNSEICINDAFKAAGSEASDKIPIPALTIDDQIYQRIPSVLVSTVDKIARLSFEARAAVLFGNVEYHHSIYGYYRRYLCSRTTSGVTVDGHPSPGGINNSYTKSIYKLQPPSLIIQDELHLIQGPLGSLVGLYEAAIEFLSGTNVKYIASTATITRAEQQVNALFNRKMSIFPASGLDINDSFFMRENSPTLDDSKAGRLYVGLFAPGKGGLTPLVRIFSNILNKIKMVKENHTEKFLEYYQTLVVYFNAIRELSGARALYRQDIPQRIREKYGKPNYDIGLTEEDLEELSSRIESTKLPVILDELDKNRKAILLTTSMFGTGIDLPKLNLMVVNGQPKTTNDYIQATGRVGRRYGGLVLTLFRASRPRDLSHYELFYKYHTQLNRFVEPSTVYPFSPGCFEKSSGPVQVAELINSYIPGETEPYLRNNPSAIINDCEITMIKEINKEFVKRADSQPKMRRLSPQYVEGKLEGNIDHWRVIAKIDELTPGRFVYAEYVQNVSEIKKDVVLGDKKHELAQKRIVFPDVQQSLRDVEESTGFQT